MVDGSQKNLKSLKNSKYDTSIPSIKTTQPCRSQKILQECQVSGQNHKKKSLKYLENNPENLKES